MSEISVSQENPIKVYPDGNFWCALIGDDLQQGLSGFGKSPEAAIARLFDQELAQEVLPHAVTPLNCPCCHYGWVAVHPFPTEGRWHCPQCEQPFQQSVEAL